MSAGLGIVRLLMAVIGALMLLGGFALVVSGVPGAAGGLSLVVTGGVFLAAVALERLRYRSEQAERAGTPPGPGGGEGLDSPMESRFRRTDEVLRGPDEPAADAGLAGSVDGRTAVPGRGMSPRPARGRATLSRRRSRPTSSSPATTAPGAHPARMTTLRVRSPRAGGRRRPAAFPYLNRELSWLDFNARVLHEARDDRNPLLERAKFLAIFASNLDEFFQVRVSGLLDQVATASAKRSPDGRTAAEQLAAIRDRVHALVPEHARIVAEVRAALAGEGVAVVDHAAIPEHHVQLRGRYLEEIFPVLTPLAVAAGHPFPFIGTLSLSLAILVRDPDSGEQRFARVKVPQILPRLVAVDARTFVPLEQVIAAKS